MFFIDSIHDIDIECNLGKMLTGLKLSIGANYIVVLDDIFDSLW